MLSWETGAGRACERVCLPERVVSSVYPIRLGGEGSGNDIGLIFLQLQKKDKEKGKSKDESLLWRLHYSSKKEQWFYFNVETEEKVWKPPKVEGWVVKSCSGKHRPYVGLRNYYFNPSTQEVKYEPPLKREKSTVGGDGGGREAGAAART